MQGWVKLHRSLQHSAVASHPEYLAVWVHLLIRATHKRHETIVGRTAVVLEPGQMVFGRKKFSAETGISENKVRAALDVLKRLEQITIKSQAKFSVISITKWSEYQEESPANNHKAASNAPATHQQTATNKNGKNGENEKKEKGSRSGASLVTFTGWLKRLEEAGEKPIPPDDSLFEYVDNAGIPHDWLRAYWVEFKTEFSEKDKRYKDWRATFRNYVRKNYYQLWWVDAGEYKLTSRGQQALMAIRGAESNEN